MKHSFIGEFKYFVVTHYYLPMPAAAFVAFSQYNKEIIGMPFNKNTQIVKAWRKCLK